MSPDRNASFNQSQGLEGVSRVKVGVIGPTNIRKLNQLTQQPIGFLLERARTIGKILAEADSELWVNSDQGMLIGVTRGYKESAGKKVVLLYPDKGEPWPKQHTTPYIRYADELRKEENWFWSNYNVTALPDLCICVGRSAGTSSELAYIKWNHQFKRGNLKRLVAVRELLIDGMLPPEIEIDIKDIVQYVEKAEDLKDFLENFKGKLKLVSGLVLPLMTQGQTPEI